MTRFAAQIARYANEKRNCERHARATAAAWLSGRVDLITADRLDERRLGSLATRLRRAIERERQRGNASHWGYDLNRHIAMKQALDEIERRIALLATGRTSDDAPIPNKRRAPRQTRRPCPD